MELVRIDIDHDPDIVDLIRDRHRPDRGVVVVGAAPESRRLHPFAADVLATFGARDDIAGPGRNLNRDLEYLWSWLRADRVEHLVVLDANWLHHTLIADVVSIVAATDVTCWLVCHEPTSRKWDAELAIWPHRSGNIEELDGRLPKPLAGVADRATTFPRVVDAAWPLFRFLCEQTLPADEFTIVEDRYRAVFEAAVAEVAGGIDETTVLAWLRDRCDGAATVDEIVTVVRATQAAAWTVGWHINVHVDQFRAVAATCVTRAHTDRADWWTPIRWYADPSRGAIAALTVARLGCDSIVDTTVADIDDTGNHTNPNVDVPVVARRWLRAQRQLRLLAGARPDDPLFVRFDDRPAHDRWAANKIIEIETDTGRNLTGGRAARGDHTAVAWSSRLGISVQPFDTAGARP